MINHSYGERVPNVNVAVCGQFLYHNFIHFLAEAGVLNKYYYSHRLTTTGKSLGIPEEAAENLFLKEHLVAAFALAFGRAGRMAGYPIYASLWESGVLRRWQPCDVLHLMLHGDGLRILTRAKQENTVTIGNPVNNHPIYMKNILDEEAERLGLQPSGALNWQQKRLLQEIELTDHLYVISGAIKSSYVAHGYPEDNISVIYPSVNLGRFRPLKKQKDDETFRVLSVGQLSMRKGHIDLIRAFRELKLKNAELTIIGASNNGIDSVIKSYQDDFTHIERIPNSELAEYYNLADVFVLPSIEDGFGAVVLEAMACGTPVIVSENVGASELVRENENGYVVPIRSPGSIAEKILALYNDRECAREMGVQAGKIAKSIPSWQDVAFRLVELYGSMCSK